MDFIINLLKALFGATPEQKANQQFAASRQAVVAAHPDPTPKLNKAGIDLIQSSESCELEAYPDPNSELGKMCEAAHIHLRSYKTITGWENKDGTPWTVGRGHTGPEVKPGMVITQTQADQIFVNDLAPRMHDTLAAFHVYGIEPNENQFAACMSFVFNCGIGNLRGAMASVKLDAKNPASFTALANKFLEYNKAKNKQTGQYEVLGGLTKRRQAEHDLFLKPVSVA